MPLKLTFEESLVSDEGKAQVESSKQAFVVKTSERPLPQPPAPAPARASGPARKPTAASFAQRRLMKSGPANSEHTATQVATPSPLRSMMTA
ncbi:prephenate dehydratase [Hypoxylon texense]